MGHVWINDEYLSLGTPTETVHYHHWKGKCHLIFTLAQATGMLGLHDVSCWNSLYIAKLLSDLRHPEMGGISPLLLSLSCPTMQSMTTTHEAAT